MKRDTDNRSFIIAQLRKLTSQSFVEIVLRGNSAIRSALSVVPSGKKVLIPEEGGWLSYRTLPQKAGLEVLEVKCRDAVLDIRDVAEKLTTQECGILLYQNPGGYFAEQPMQQIYELCRKYGCLVIMDVSGSIGTDLCDGRYADLMVGSFGEWKLVEAKGGGFISCRDKRLFDQLTLQWLNDEVQLRVIAQELEGLPARIAFLMQHRQRIMKDLEELHEFDVVRRTDKGFVVVVRFCGAEEKQQILEYCQKQHLEWTECPRYIRLNAPAISIEVKRLQA